MDQDPRFCIPNYWLPGPQRECPPDNLHGIVHPNLVGHWRLDGLGAALPAASREQKLAWLSQLDSLEAQKKAGDNAQLIHRQADALLQEFSRYGDWPYESGGFFGKSTPEKSVYNQRAGALKIISAARLDPVQANQEAARSPTGGHLIKQVKDNPAIVQNAEESLKIAEQASKNPIQQKIEFEAGILKSAADKTVDDLTNDPLGLGVNMKWLLIGGAALAGLAILAPYVKLGSAALRRNPKKKRRRRRSR